MAVGHQPLKCVSASYALNFPRVLLIRREANKIEDLLQERYSQPVMFSVPDEIDPTVVRMSFPSKNGFSSINITQVSIGIVVNFSDNEWQLDTALRRAYLEPRVELLFDIASLIGVAHIMFSGITNGYVMAAEASDSVILGKLASLYTNDVEYNIADLQIKRTLNLNDRYFVNQTVFNFRRWDAFNPFVLTPLPYAKASSRGIALTLDVNDRLAFNEEASYVSSKQASREMLNVVDDVAAATARRLEEGFGEL